MGRRLRSFGRVARLGVAILLAGVVAGTVVVFSPGGTTELAYGQQPDPSVMQQKLDQAIGVLNDANSGPDVAEEAVQEIFDALFTSNLVVLPTRDGQGLAETDQNFQEFQQMVDQAIAALDGHATTNGAAAGDALEAADFLLLFDEAIREIGALTRECFVGNLDTADGACALLRQQDQTPPIVDDTLGSGVFQRLVRSPFPLVGQADPEPPTEVVVPVDALANGECAPVMKEVRGVAAVVRLTSVPVWVEPWTARARIIGVRDVWALEFVPADYLKTVSYCNQAGAVTSTISSLITLDRGALPLWKGLYDTVVAG